MESANNSYRVQMPYQSDIENSNTIEIPSCDENYDNLKKIKRDRERP
jgi:hypothetical protein